MPVLIKMPKWGLTMKAGKITEWLRPEGAEVAAGEALLVVETDKAVNDVEAPASGVLRKIVAQTGDEVLVSDPVAVIASVGETLSDDEVATLLAAAAEQKRSVAAGRAGTARAAREARPAKRTENGRANASPAARKLARELGVDLSIVLATGPGGRITSDDVERAFVEQIGAREDYLTLPDGMRLFYVLAGRGEPPLVFLHGIGGTQSTWQAVLPAFAAHYRVCAVDLPGHGKSDKPAPETADYSLVGMGRAAAQALDALHLVPAVLIGHSLGGAVAMQVALENPEIVSRLVLVDCAGLGTEINPELLDRVEAEPSREEARKLLDLFFYDPRYILESGVEDTYRQRMEPGAQEALRTIAAANFGRSGQRTGLPPRLGQVKVPVLILWGAEDRVIPATHAQLGAQGMGRAQVAILEGVGHVPQLEDADGFVAAVQSFLRRRPDE
jgi:pyruvate dehydrogenase E2 component (dihydrolipoamide acetyltransferase)